ncbi:hypothetical protein [Candidatus Pantoea formicae]|uniref:hypothetical protein n=1 Tax=Candidatus Pantoea formicae TaxID=2608355 RepID=UPI003EDB60C0
MEGQFHLKAVVLSLIKWLAIPAFIAFIIVNGIRNILPANNAWAEHPERVGLVLLAVVLCCVFGWDRIRSLFKTRRRK